MNFQTVITDFKRIQIDGQEWRALVHHTLLKTIRLAVF